MSEAVGMRAFTNLCGFVDRDLSRAPVTTAGSLSLLLGLLPWIALGWLRQTSSRDFAAQLLLPVAILTVVWVGFVAWRGWRLFQAFANRADDLYDRQSKYDLPPEYAKSESSTRAKRRRNKKGG